MAAAESSYPERNPLILSRIGDIELLEAIVARHEVLQSRGDTQCEVTEQFHDWVLRGMCSSNYLSKQLVMLT